MHGNVIPLQRLWSSDEIEALKAGFAAGLDDSQLSVKTGRAVDGVAAKRHQLYLFRPHTSWVTKWAPELVEKLRELAAQGFSGARIGEMLGFSRGAIIGKCDREGIALHGKVRFQNKEKRIRIRKYNPRSNLAPLTRPKVVRQRIEILPWKKSEVVPLRVSLLDLKSELQCHQIIDGETDDDCCPIYCGHPIFKRSYCFEHYRENHQGTRVNA